MTEPPLIVESLVTTVAADGAVNVAPMGVEWGEQTIVLKPFLETATFRNLQAVPAAVVHLVDDAMLFVESALEQPTYPTGPAAHVRGAVLGAACAWREVEVVSVDASPPRSRIVTRVVGAGRRRDFLGFNRARHAILEGTILATRLHLLPADDVLAELERLTPLVEKTGGARERTAWARLRHLVSERLAAGVAR